MAHTYTYGGDQKRRSRAVSGGDTIPYRYDRGWNVVNEEDGSGTLETTYVHSPVRQIGTVLATSSGSTASSGTFAYYFQDAIGSTRGLWDNSGDRLGKYDYTPFGGKYSEHGEDIARKFTGHDWDSETRLYYTAYRYYSPDSNRWLTRDPLGMVDGPNVYAYVVGNPVSMVDASGQASGTMTWGGGYGGAAGSAAAAAILIYVLAIEFQLYDLENGTRLSDIFAAMVAAGIATMAVLGNPSSDGTTCGTGSPPSVPPGGPEPPSSNGCSAYCLRTYPSGSLRRATCLGICLVIGAIRGYNSW